MSLYLKTLSSDDVLLCFTLRLYPLTRTVSLYLKTLSSDDVLLCFTLLLYPLTRTVSLYLKTLSSDDVLLCFTLRLYPLTRTVSLYMKTRSTDDVLMFDTTTIPINPNCDSVCCQRRPRRPGRGDVQPRHAARVLRPAAHVLSAVAVLHTPAVSAPEHPVGVQEHHALPHAVHHGQYTPDCRL